MSEQITEGESLIANAIQAIYSADDDVPFVAFALGAAEVNTQLQVMRQLAQEFAEVILLMSAFYKPCDGSGCRAAVCDPFCSYDNDRIQAAIASARNVGLMP